MRYGAAIDDDGVKGYIKCLPMDCQVASWNVSALLAFSGLSHVPSQDYLLAVDNKLRPYHIQSYAGIKLYGKTAGRETAGGGGGGGGGTAGEEAAGGGDSGG